MSACILALFNVVFGLMQGIIVWNFTEYVPPRQQKWIDAALHQGGVLLYSIVVGGITIYQILLLDLLPWEWSRWALVLGLTATKSFLLRALLFDPALNLARNWYTHREKKVAMDWNVFAVGGSARSDRFILWLTLASWPAIRWLQARFIKPAFIWLPAPWEVRAGCWLLSNVIAIVFFLYQ